ncbi:MAG: cysteine desulfurase family protein [Bdellovibrionota bacterium]
MDQSRLYLDHNATTPVDPEVIHVLPEWVAAWGNPSSIHQEGRGPKFLLRESRRQISSAIGANNLEIIFNSGASEGNNTVIKSFWPPTNPNRSEFICSAAEHPSVTKTMQWLETQGATVHYVPVNLEGELDIEFYLSKLSERTALVSIMYANNETGMIFPVAGLSQAAHKVGAYFHSDCVQALGKIPVNVTELGVDYATFSGHKIYALKGTGFIYVKKGSPFQNLIHGGGQERARRGGTENVPGIASAGFMAQKITSTVALQYDHLQTLRDHFEDRVLKEIPNVRINCAKVSRLPNTSSLIIDGIDGETLLMSLDLKGFAVSTGAACSSGNPEPSPVLIAMGLTRSQAQSSLRVSFGRFQNLQNADRFVDVLKEVVQRLRTISSIEESRHHGI